jgi:hypothetical protein
MSVAPSISCFEPTFPRMPPPTTAKMAGIGDFLKLQGVASRQSHGGGARVRRRLARSVQIPQAQVDPA